MTLFQSPARRRMRPIFSSALAVSFLLALHPTGLGQASKEPENKKWRQDREAELKREDGWLSLVGLFWLKDGANSVGSARENDVVLPAGSAPARAGQIYLKDGKATLTFRSGVTATVDNQQVSSVELTTDDQHPSPVVSLGTVRMTLIKREDRFGIRLRDSNSPSRRQFTGLTWFPFNEALRVNAKLERFDTPKDVDVPNVLGGAYKMKSPGLLEFQLNGQKFTLMPVSEDDQLFIIFRDKTSGKTTYGGGRFLYADPPGADGNVVLDFNRAYNPPAPLPLMRHAPYLRRRTALEQQSKLVKRHTVQIQATVLWSDSRAAGLSMHFGNYLDSPEALRQF